MSDTKIINNNYLDLLKYSEEFLNQSPFPYLVLDNFLDDSFFSKIKNSLDLDKSKGKNFNNAVEKNKWISKNTDLSNELQKIIKFLNSPEWISNLEKFTTLNKLITSKLSNTYLANYHEMETNGFLGSHVDHSSDPDTGFPHVLNVVLYLTDNWDKDWGGGTTLLDSKGRKIQKVVNYKPNRALIFLHTPYSFHGVERIHNNRLKRSSIYVDYYSESFNPYKNLNLKFNNKWFRHSTCFIMPNFIDYLLPKNFYYTKTRIKYFISSLLN